MDRNAFIDYIQQQRRAQGLSLQRLAARSGLSEKSVRNALHPLGNPRLSSLLALMDALGLELHVAPQGFGPPSGFGETDYQPVRTLVDAALNRNTAI